MNYFFIGLATIFLASLTIVVYIRNEATKSKEKIEEIIKEKNILIDRAFTAISASVSGRLFNDILTKYDVEQEGSFKDLQEELVRIGEEHRADIAELMKLTEEENDLFMRTALLRVGVNSLPYEYTIIINSSSKALIYGIASAVLVYILGYLGELTKPILFLNIAPYSAVVVITILFLFCTISYISNGLLQIFELNKLVEKRDEVIMAYNFESLEDAIS